MTDINSVTLVGRIVRDLDEKSYGKLPNGTARANISLAVNRSVKKDDQWTDETSFIDVTVWGKTAENLQPYLVKGQQVAVLGHLKQDRWEKDGKKNSRLSVVADNIQLVGGRKEGSRGQDAPQGFDPAAGFPSDIPF